MRFIYLLILLHVFLFSDSQLFAQSCTISLTSANATDSQVVCINTPITNITYSTTRATGATFSGLPPGIRGSWADSVVTISGSPTATLFPDRWFSMFEWQFRSAHPDGTSLDRLRGTAGGTCCDFLSCGRSPRHSTPQQARGAIFEYSR